MIQTTQKDENDELLCIDHGAEHRLPHACEDRYHDEAYNEAIVSILTGLWSSLALNGSRS
jgi:hypothetical protein